MWNKENTQKVIEMYNNAGNEGLKDIAKEFGTSVQSVRSKLVSAKVYQKQERKVGGASSVRKTQLVRDIAERMGLENAESLENATKATLEELLAKLVK